MSKFTLYRADVDSPRLARVLGKVPGLAVADEGAAGEVSDQPTEETATMADEDDGGLGEKIPVPDTDGDKTSVVKTYGLLGLGVSMVMLGVATVGIWVYLRRKGGDEESETPPPSTGLATEGTTPSPTGPVTTETELSAGDTEPGSSDLSIVRPDEEEGERVTDERPEDEPAAEPEPRGRTEGDRSDVEWTTKDTAPTEPTAGDEMGELSPEEAELSAEETELSADEAESRPSESVDAAPLLGAAFLALSGAVVKWLQSGDET